MSRYFKYLLIGALEVLKFLSVILFLVAAVMGLMWFAENHPKGFIVSLEVFIVLFILPLVGYVSERLKWKL